VFFLGALNDTTPAYLSATCLVHPTREDTFAMVVLEAMAFGLPVVVSNANFCGVAAMLSHRKNALLLSNPLDSVELSNAVHEVLSDGALSAFLGERARSFAANFDWGRLAKQQESIYFDSVNAKSE
jgi:glycosyltransferase involved in cell wall biosynthesis